MTRPDRPVFWTIHSGLFTGVMRHLAIDHDGQVLPCLQELHDFGALTREMSPARLGVGILLDAAVVLALKGEIHFNKTLGGRFANGEDSPARLASWSGLPEPDAKPRSKLHQSV